MTEDQMRAAFEHCDPARYQEFYNTVRVLAARPDITEITRLRALGLSKNSFRSPICKAV